MNPQNEPIRNLVPHIIGAAIVFSLALSVIFYHRDAVDKQKADEEQAQLAILCASPLSPGEVETPRCVEYRANQQKKLAGGDGGK